MNMKLLLTKPYITIGEYFNKEHLLTVFEYYKDQKLQPYYAKSPDGTILKERKYYEMYFKYDDGKDLFDTPKCRGYQYVLMPPKYEMVVHKDIEYLKCRIGTLLQGSASIVFYNDDLEQIGEYNYKEDILTDVQVMHNVINTDEWRLTFFANFEEPIDVIRHKIHNSVR